MSPIEWPVAKLDPIRRARVLASAIPGAASAEAVIDAPYDATWAWVTEFEHSVPRFDRSVRKIRVHERVRDDDGVEHIRLTANRVQGFDVRVEDGFCLMSGRARLYLVVIAAVPVDGGARTRFLHTEAVPLPGARVLQPLLQRAVDADLRRLRAIAESGF